MNQKLEESDFYTVIILSGLLGTNNMEYADDLRLPDGRIAVDIVEFLQSWQLSDDEKCKDIDNEDFALPCSTSSSERCEALFKDKKSNLSRLELFIFFIQK